MEEGLGGDAPPVEAGAPHLAGLKEGHGQAALRGPEGGGAAAGPSADDNQLIHGSALREGVPHHRAAGGGGLVGAAHRRARRGGVEGLRLLLRPAQNLRQHRRRLVQRLRDSVSVGSNISASWTMRGKYIVGGWMPRVQHALGHIQRGNARLLFELLQISTNSCMQRPGKAEI